MRFDPSHCSNFLIKKHMRKLNTFYQCCRYLDISIDLPECQVDQKQIQAAYKLRVCMKAWNEQDEYKPDETAVWNDKNVSYTPFFYIKDGKFLLSGNAFSGSYTGIITAYAYYSDGITIAHFGLRLCFKTQERAIEFGETFIETFNELLITNE